MNNSNFKFVDGFKADFTALPYGPLFDANLTSDAKVVLLAFFVFPRDYHVTTKNISITLDMSETRVQNAVRRLKETGYISVESVTDGSKFGGYLWHISGTEGTFTTNNEA